MMVGMISLIGIIFFSGTKQNAILIVDYTNQLRLSIKDGTVQEAVLGRLGWCARDKS